MKSTELPQVKAAACPEQHPGLSGKHMGCGAAAGLGLCQGSAGEGEGKGPCPGLRMIEISDSSCSLGDIQPLAASLKDKAISGLSGGQGLIFAGQPVLLWPPPANPPHFRASQQGKGRFPLAQLQPQQAVLAHRGTAASWADGGAAHGPAYCPCYVAARTYANQSHKTRLFMLFPPSFQNRYHFLSATGDAQPFTKGRRCLV